MFKFSILIPLFILFSFEYLYAQPAKDHFILNGKITGIDNGVIYLGYYDDIQQSGKSDSSLIRNGLFSFSGKLTQPAVAFLALNKREAFGLNATNIFIEPGKMNISIELNKFDNAHLTGSNTQNDYEEIRTKRNKIIINHPRLFDSNGYVSKGLNDSLSEKITIVFDTLNSIDYEYFNQHPASYLTAYLLKYQVRNLSPDSLAMFYNRLGDNLKHHVVTQTIRSRLKNMRAGS